MTGEQIRRLRTHMNLTVDQFAQTLNSNKWSVQNWERKARHPNKLILGQLNSLWRIYFHQEVPSENVNRGCDHSGNL
jgi:transcriptional regulator with XRE-family HTH domain